MNRRQAENWNRTQDALLALGFTRDEVEALFRIERTLSNWATEECNGTIQRDEMTQKPYRYYGFDADHREPIPDREAGALRRLDAIVAPHKRRLASYHQGDPRGCALYIVKKSDLKGQDIGSVYNRGVAVCY